MPPLCIFVSYCSNERLFSDALFGSLRSICAAMLGTHVFVSIGSHLYTGQPEDEAHIGWIEREFPEFEIVRYAVSPGGSTTVHPIVFHNAARIAAVNRAMAEASSSGFWGLFLDGDEIPDARGFTEWYNSSIIRANQRKKVMKLANYWYFMHPRLVSRDFEDSVVLAHSSVLSGAALSHPRERDGIVLEAATTNNEVAERDVCGLDARPMFHHYSWVRACEEDLLRKVANWGHRDDKPWASLIKGAVALIEGGDWPSHDFVHGHTLSVMQRPVHKIAVKHNPPETLPTIQAA